MLLRAQTSIVRDLPKLLFCGFCKIHTMPVKSVEKRKKQTYGKQNAGSLEEASNPQGTAAALRTGKGGLPTRRATSKMAPTATPHH